MWASALKSFQSNISSNYKIADQPTCSAGPWKVFDAKHKSSGKVVSVFVFDKRTLESQGGGLGSRSGASALKKLHEDVVERLKREASSLARLRHPSILELVEPVEETRNGGLMFATEMVTATLAGLLAQQDDEDRASSARGRHGRGGASDPDDRGGRGKEVQLDQLEIQKGLLQLGKGLEFLHESAGLVHGNLVPEAIFVNAKSDWKLSGLGFSGRNEDSSTSTSLPGIPLHELLNNDSRLPTSVQLNIDYTSPDFVIDNTVTSAADMFSLGLLIVALFNSPHQSPLHTNQSISAYKRMFSSASTSPSPNNNFLCSSTLPQDVSRLLPRLLARRSAQRLNAKDFQNAQFFDNILVSTIRFLEALPAKTPNEKNMFLRGLPRILPQFPKSVLEKKVLPALLEEMKDKDLIALVLQNVFKMLKYMPSGKRAFSEKIIPRLREVFLGGAVGKAVAPTPEKDLAKAAGLMILLENIQIIADNTNGKEFEENIWPIIRMSMESSAHTLVDIALRTLSVMLAVLDFPTIKNDVFPVIAAVFSKTNSLGIKIRGLEALQTLCGGTPGQDDFSTDGLDGLPENQARDRKGSVILDKYTIQEKVIPLLKAIKTKEPAVMMAALEVFNEIGKLVDADVLATEVLPIIWSFSLGPLLNLQQFQAFMVLVSTCTNRIISEQSRKLRELSATQPPIANRNDFMTFARLSQPHDVTNTASIGESDFESLVLDRIEPKATTKNSSTAASQGWTNSTPTLSVQQSNSSAAVPISAPMLQPATFAWSTPATTTTALQPSRPANHSFRTVTPDQSMNTYPTMTPTLTQPWQPSATTVLPFTKAPSNSNGLSSAWSTSTTGSTSSADIWASPHLSQPQIQSISTASAHTGIGGAMSASKSANPYSSFGIAPPSAQRQLSSRQESLGKSSNPAQSGQITGLDKYESLI